MTVTLTIGRSSVLSDLRVKSHAEAAAISDAEERYIVEAGTEKLPEIHECITEAFAEASAILRPFLSGTASASANDTYRSTGDLSLSLDVTTRKASGLAQPLTDAVHAYVVDCALARFYRAVGRPQMGEIHHNSLADDRAAIDALILTRKKPTYA